ncbi:MAG: hypothetical protein K2M56_01125 [Muribaculaceae bacterium]|nr:hypothetical protein [Muribaculaceae bacterium]
MKILEIKERSGGVSLSTGGISARRMKCKEVPLARAGVPVAPFFYYVFREGVEGENCRG